MNSGFWKVHIRPLWRYGFVGIASNAILYLLYILITASGVGHKLTMTLIFLVGVFQTFTLNKLWTFGHIGYFGPTFARYIFVYIFAWGLNLIALFVFTDSFGFSHQVVQGIAIVALALLLFLAQKLWVFQDRSQLLINNVDSSRAGRKF